MRRERATSLLALHLTNISSHPVALYPFHLSEDTYHTQAHTIDRNAQQSNDVA